MVTIDDCIGHRECLHGLSQTASVVSEYTYVMQILFCVRTFWYFILNCIIKYQQNLEEEKENIYSYHDVQ